MTINTQADRDWSGYYDAQAGRSPRPLLLNALRRFAAPAPHDAPRFAIDLGCGEGTETRALLEQGWRVLAIDQEPAAIHHVVAKTPAAHSARLETQVATFETMTLPAADPSIGLVLPG